MKQTLESIIDYLETALAISREEGDCTVLEHAVIKTCRTCRLALEKLKEIEKK